MLRFGGFVSFSPPQRRYFVCTGCFRLCGFSLASGRCSSRGWWWSEWCCDRAFVGGGTAAVGSRYPRRRASNSRRHESTIDTDGEGSRVLGRWRGWWQKKVTRHQRLSERQGESIDDRGGEELEGETVSQV